MCRCGNERGNTPVQVTFRFGAILKPRTCVRVSLNEFPAPSSTSIKSVSAGAGFGVNCAMVFVGINLVDYSCVARLGSPRFTGLGYPNRFPRRHRAVQNLIRQINQRGQLIARRNALAVALSGVHQNLWVGGHFTNWLWHRPDKSGRATDRPERCTLNSIALRQPKKPGRCSHRQIVQRAKSRQAVGRRAGCTWRCTARLLQASLGRWQALVILRLPPALPSCRRCRPRHPSLSVCPSTGRFRPRPFPKTIRLRSPRCAGT